MHDCPLGWHYDEDIGAMVRDVIHRMGRRCRNWDYRGRGIYQVTITLADRKSRALGQLRYEPTQGAFVELSEVGRMVSATWAEIAGQWAGVETLGLQVMPDHIHGIIAVRQRQKKGLGAIVGSFKAKATSRWLQLCRKRQSATEAAKPSEAMGSRPSEAMGARPSETAVARPAANGCGCATARAPSLWAEGYVDTIVFDEKALENELAYLADNPRRLWEKLAHPELFTVLRDLPIVWRSLSLVLARLRLFIGGLLPMALKGL